MKVNAKHQIIIALVLFLLMLATRGQHFASINAMPGASWAVFFLAAVFLGSVWALPAFLLMAWGMDFSVFLFGDGSDYCLTPAYFFLLPAYSSMWLAGRLYRKLHSDQPRSLVWLAVTGFAGATFCELFSSGGFYLYSGYFQPSLGEFLQREMKYFPPYLQSVAFYLGLATVIYGIFTLMAKTGNKQHV